MAVLLVVGDSRSGQDFSELLDVVEQRSRTQLAETAYAMDTDESLETVCDNLVARFGTEDQVYVIAVTGPYKGFYKGLGPEDVDSCPEEQFRGLEDHLNYYGR